ncbi:AMIN-like domain-containing (lipo)protein [Trujillonella humicola]|uniref:AMIN-like domain-containing (lipo)protein n=1 Tax=Trujillonella humicola TaxID=3383699 RepID=UPI0039066D22
MRTRRCTTPVQALLAAALLLAGCGADDDGRPAGSTGAAGDTAASGTASPDGGDGGGSGEGSAGNGGDGSGDSPPFPSDVQPDRQEASAGAQVTVTDIRTGGHEGFDRVVFEVAGEGAPGWDVGYVEDPTSQGSGAPVEVAGEAVLMVTLTGVGYPFDTGVDQFEPGGPVAGPGAAVTEVVLGATFEGTTESFVGTTGESPFRVYLLEGPTRVVVEVADPS